MWFIRTKMALHTCCVAHSGRPERDFELSTELGEIEFDAPRAAAATAAPEFELPLAANELAVMFLCGLRV